MAQGPRPAKVREWTQRLARYAASGQTVTEFCKTEQVSPPSFYHWKKVLGDRDNAEPAPRPAFQKVRVVESRSPAVGLSVRLPNDVEIVVGSDVQLAELTLDKVIATCARSFGG